MIETVGKLLVAIPVIVLFYAYVGYPVLLWVATLFNDRKSAKSVGPLPRVSVVVPAYNEERQIAGAIDALLSQDYPSELLQILVLSDASSDGTDEIVRGYSDRGVELLRMPERGGKTKAENAACALIRGEIVVNTDSTIRLHHSAVTELVKHMQDSSVGVASGRDVSVSPTSDRINPTEAGYVGYEMGVRTLETRTGGIVGASGSCYAIRTALHRIPIRDDLSRDFSAALTAAEHGLRAVSVDTAVCFVPRTPTLQREYRRKVRTIARGMRTLYERRSLLDPMQHGAFAWKLFSHKLCRWLVPLSAVLGVVGLALLAPSNAWARAGVVLAAIVAILAASGALWPSGRPMPRVFSLAAFGVAANVAVLGALWRVFMGQKDSVWEPTRRSV